MKKMLVSAALLATLVLGLVAKIKEPDAGIYPPPIKYELACILIAHR